MRTQWALVNDLLLRQCDREPAAVPPFRMWIIGCIIRPPTRSRTVISSPHTTYTKMILFKNKSILNQGQFSFLAGKLTSFASVWAFEQSGLCTRGRRLCRTAVRIGKALATAGPNRRPWAAVTRPASDAIPCLFNCVWSLWSAATNSA